MAKNKYRTHKTIASTLSLVMFVTGLFVAISPSSSQAVTPGQTITQAIESFNPPTPIAPEKNMALPAAQRDPTVAPSPTQATRDLVIELPDSRPGGTKIKANVRITKTTRPTTFTPVYNWSAMQNFGYNGWQSLNYEGQWLGPGGLSGSGNPGYAGPESGWSIMTVPLNNMGVWGNYRAYQMSNTFSWTQGYQSPNLTSYLPYWNLLWRAPTYYDNIRGQWVAGVDDPNYRAAIWNNSDDDTIVGPDRDCRPYDRFAPWRYSWGPGARINPCGDEPHMGGDYSFMYYGGFVRYNTIMRNLDRNASHWNFATTTDVTYTVNAEGACSGTLFTGSSDNVNAGALNAITLSYDQNGATQNVKIEYAGISRTENITGQCPIDKVNPASKFTTNLTIQSASPSLGLALGCYRLRATLDNPPVTSPITYEWFVNGLAKPEYQNQTNPIICAAPGVPAYVEVRASAPAYSPSTSNPVLINAAVANVVASQPAGCIKVSSAGTLPPQSTNTTYAWLVDGSVDSSIPAEGGYKCFAPGIHTIQLQVTTGTQPPQLSNLITVNYYVGPPGGPDDPNNGGGPGDGVIVVTPPQILPS